MAMKPMIIDLFPRGDSADEPETPLDPERLAAQAGWLREGIRLAIADLGRLARRMDVHVSGYSDRSEVDRIATELRRTIEGEQEAGQ